MALTLALSPDWWGARKASSGSRERSGLQQTTTRSQAGNMVRFYAPNSGWLSSWGLAIGLFEQSGNPSLVVPWFDVSRLFRVVVWLPFCPTLPILTEITFNLFQELVLHTHTHTHTLTHSLTYRKHLGEQHILL